MHTLFSIRSMAFSDLGDNSFRQYFPLLLFPLALWCPWVEFRRGDTTIRERTTCKGPFNSTHLFYVVFLCCRLGNHIICTIIYTQPHNWPLYKT
ncbi:origin of replication complex subunit 1 [Iris pallida]|uniref:Origin of replication complex subunit 1 n=1 Tax=Iris pallida TaxID=29817 RepID=A0AAX6DZF9_IRIPA|nr:origin of replication complex subunit 1 [Iris pallida]